LFIHNKAAGPMSRPAEVGETGCCRSPKGDLAAAAATAERIAATVALIENPILPTTPCHPDALAAHGVAA
jgi:hypothetical protein